MTRARDIYSLLDAARAVEATDRDRATLARELRALIGDRCWVRVQRTHVAGNEDEEDSTFSIDIGESGRTSADVGVSMDDATTIDGARGHLAWLLAKARVERFQGGAD